MPSPKPAFSSKRAANPQFVDKIEGEKLDQLLHQRLSARAYALYEESGRQDGNDQENWLLAKSEIVKGLETRMSGTWVALTASIPEASPESIRVYVDTNRVVVEAEKIAGTSAAEGSAHETLMFFAADLEVDLDPLTATASFKDHTLNLMVKKRRSASNG